MRSVDPMARRAKSHRGDLERRCCLRSAGATTRDKESMVQRKPVAFRLWASVAIGAPPLVEQLATPVRGAPGLGGGRSARLGLLLLLVGVEMHGRCGSSAGTRPGFGRAGDARDERGTVPPLPQPPCSSVSSRSTWKWRLLAPTLWGLVLSRPRCCSSSGRDTPFAQFEPRLNTVKKGPRSS
jgi:hypothetical protein